MSFFKTFLLMSAMMILLLIIGSALGGERGLMIAFVFSLVMNFGSYWFSDKIVLSMYRAQEAPADKFEGLYAVVQKLSSDADLPMPKVYVIDNPTPNAFATGRNPEHAAVAVTTGILNVLNRDEIEGVLGHELTHVKNRDILTGTIAAVIVGTITFLARLAGYAAIFGGRSDSRDSGGISSLVLLILSPVIAVMLQMAISRSREYAADSGGAEISGKPLALASALNKLESVNKKFPINSASPSSAHLFIVNPLSGKSLMKLFSTHPPTEERIKRLNEIAAGQRI